MTETKQARDLFVKNGLSPAPDQELTDLIADNLQYCREDDLSMFLQAQKRFDGPVSMMDTGENVEHYNLRQTLKVLPDYMQAAERAGLTYETANDLLLFTMNALRYDFVQEYRTLDRLTRAVNRTAEQKADLPSNLDQFKEMVKLGAEEGVVDGSLYAFSIANRIGLSIEQACKMIMRLPDADGALSGYTFPHFSDALKSLRFAKVDPELVVEAFELMGGERPYFTQGDYSGFEMLITFGCPGYGVTPNEMINMFVAHAKNGKSEDAPMLEGFDDKLKEKKDAKNIERYFMEADGPLEHAALPYRNKRSLNEGIRDLERLATARSGRGEEVGEGMWVFDPETSIWYSLGGKLEHISLEQVLAGAVDRVRHNFISYDVSRLSSSPMFFHVHPEGFDSFVAPPRESLAYPSLRDELTKFLTATPSRADYAVIADAIKEAAGEVHPQAYIVHSIGTTQFHVPSDISQIERMSQDSRDIRDRAMLEFNVKKYFATQEKGPKYFNFVERVIHDQNKILPKEFQIALYPTNFNFESEVIGK